MTMWSSGLSTEPEREKGVLILRNNKVQKPESSYYMFRIHWVVGKAGI